MKHYKFNSTLAFLTILLLTACTPSSTSPLNPSSSISTTESTNQHIPTIDSLTFETLASDIKAKYLNDTSYHLDETVYVLERNEVLTINLDFPMTNQHNTYDMFQFFLDPELTIPIWRPAPETYYIGDTRVKIKPKSLPLFATEFQEPTRRQDADWGNVGTLYLAKYYDSQGNVTQTPQEVSIIKIKTELPRPEVNLVADEQGLATLTWSPVKGATRYLVYSIQLFDNQISDDEILYLCGTTTETTFNDFSIWTYDTSSITGVETNSVLSINDDFLYKEDGFCNGYVVMAENESGRSEISRLIRPNDYASILPNTCDYSTLKSESLSTDSILELPFYYPIKMCDESTVWYPLNYDLDRVQPCLDTLPIQVDGKGTAQRMSIVATPKGTPFERVFYFYYYPEKEDISQVLTDFIQRQKEVCINASGLNKQPTLETVQEDTKLPDQPQTQTLTIDTKLPITATNSLGEYLAYNMLSGITSIPLNDFPDASDTTYLWDAFSEVLYQNPLIFGIEEAFINPYNNQLVVTYSLDRKEQEKRQQQVLKEANSIVEQVIASNMSDFEKEMALHNYLCEILTYDTAALESAEKNNYKYSDPEFDDSFTVYGALIHHVCVCKGYAEAFKLLADLSGLNSLVVTGKVDSVGHAWNKVYIDGEWLTLDVTNNDNEFIPNALFNLPDSAASLILIEDKHYILDSKYAAYHGSSNTSYEYYHATHNYFDQDQLPQTIADKLSASNEPLIIRTTFDITDEALSKLIDEAYYQIPSNIGFTYYNWLGVIHIKPQ